jgi:GNAT superfamily N-acetyltransferase
MDTAKIQIEIYSDRIKNCLEHRKVAANWIYGEFIHNIRRGVTYEDVYNRFENGVPGRLPVRFLALTDDMCVGTVSIVKNDLSGREYGPWLASLFVRPDFRSKGIGRLLIEKVKSAVWDMGYEELYLRTEHAGDYYRKLGWTFVEQCTDEFGLAPEVFRWKKTR